MGWQEVEEIARQDVEQAGLILPHHQHPDLLIFNATNLQPRCQWM